MKSIMEVSVAASGSRVDLHDARVGDDALSRECVVLAAIERQQGKEEEEQTEEQHSFDDDDDPCIDWEICAAAPLELQSSGGGDASLVAYAACERSESIGPLAMSVPVGGSASDRKMEHYKMASEEGFHAFVCQCPIAKARGAMSCLERFGKEHYRRWHTETCELCAHIATCTRTNAVQCSKPSLTSACNRLADGGPLAEGKTRPKDIEHSLHEKMYCTHIQPEPSCRRAPGCQKGF